MTVDTSEQSSREQSSWYLQCKMPDGFHKLEPDVQEWVVKAIESAAKIEGVAPSVLATRDCSWHWHPYNREVSK